MEEAKYTGILGCSIDVQDMSEETEKEINDISSRINIKEISINYGENETNDVYTKEEYVILRNKIRAILSNVDKSKPDIDKFMQTYQILGRYIEYDFDDNGEPSKRSEAYNLIGGLLEGKSVCEGYAKILQQALKILGIECKIIIGTQSPVDDGQKVLHAWNQVKIDGIWYNCDLTWDSERIKENRPLEDCLQSDEKFLFHYAKCEDNQKCSKSYERGKVNEYLKRNFEHEER